MCYIFSLWLPKGPYETHSGGFTASSYCVSHALMCLHVIEELQQPMASPVYGLGGGVHPVISSSRALHSVAVAI